jgi:hypothetical protein
MQLFQFVDFTASDALTAFLLASRLQRFRRRRVLEALLQRRRPEAAVQRRPTLQGLAHPEGDSIYAYICAA